MKSKNVQLITSPAEYGHCHWFPNSYSIIKDHTPESVWIPIENGLDFRAATSALKPFGSSPAIVKDYVKSRKHEWFDACFIPDASDESHVRRVVENFLELQGDDLQGGLVFRKFVPFELLGTHPKSGMPLTLEYRLFVLDGSIIAACPYWDVEIAGDRPPLAHFEKVLKDVKSRFFSSDIAKTTEGHWLIVELGDGQVSGLPERCDPATFYRTFSDRFSA